LSIYEPKSRKPISNSNYLEIRSQNIIQLERCDDTLIKVLACKS
jgi:hypothetical protein